MQAERVQRLIIVCGLSFAGKSTLAKAICERFGYVEADVDETKCRLYGQSVQDQDLIRTQWETIYRETDAQISAYLRQGRSVIDASRHFRKAEREHTSDIARQFGALLVVVYVDTPYPVAWQRWLENVRKQTRRQVSSDDFLEIAAGMEPPRAEENPLVFHYDEDIGKWLERHVDRLASGTRKPDYSAHPYG
ncbi:MAG: ATP-binding protein [Chloroflexi bacterium]|nr:ATP-binding protein [Chloroflexota bacterium]